ncbi:MAG: hypothetical protein WAM66_13320 [Acidobacteriaceae bacterium]
MNQNVKKLETAFLGTPRISVNRFSRGAFAILGIFAFLFATANAKAACSDPRGGSMDPMHFPSVAQGPNGWGASIVGLWHVTYTIGDTTALFGESFDEWHSDGTEFENIDHSPGSGNICFGVWRQIAPRTVRLHHIGWTFAEDGTLTGTFTLDEVNVVGLRGMTYSGLFTFKVYDTNGDYVSGSEVTGKTAATRITVN